MLSNKRIAITGMGTMGRVIAAGLLRDGRIAPNCIRGTARSDRTVRRIADELAIDCSTDNRAAAQWADVILLAVKPDDVTQVLSEADLASGGETHTHDGRPPLIISVAAGVRTSLIQSLVAPDVPVIRAMPNTPCLIDRGMTVLARGSHATSDHIALATEIFQTLGRCIELDEKHMDTVTGLSASGPAFIYVMIEALADGGVMCGLPRKVATELVAQMTLGAAEMVLTTGNHPAALKDDVTTPAGCTIAGILALEDGRIRSVLARAVQETARVAGSLGTDAT